MASTATAPRRYARPAVIKIIAVLAGIAVLLAAYRFLPLGAWTEAFRGWIEALGPLGWLVFLVIYALATAALAPGSVLTIAAGLAFGLWGFPLVVVAATLGASIAFLAARYLIRERVRRTIAERPRFRAVDAAIEDEGWKVVGLLRLSPAVPFSLQNWFFGTTSVHFVPYLLATFFGIMPGTLLYIWIGSLGGAAATDEGTSTIEILFFVVGIVSTLLVTVLVGRKAKQKLRQHGVNEAEG